MRGSSASAIVKGHNADISLLRMAWTMLYQQVMNYYCLLGGSPMATKLKITVEMATHVQ